MTIRVDMVDLECLDSSVWRPWLNMSNHTHDVDLTQAAGGYLNGSGGTLHNNTATRFKGQVADCTRDFFDTFGSCGMQHDGDDDEVAVVMDGCCQPCLILLRCIFFRRR